MSIMKSNQCLTHFRNPTVLHITTIYKVKKHLSFGFSEHISVKVTDVHLNLLRKKYSSWDWRMMGGMFACLKILAWMMMTLPEIWPNLSIGHLQHSSGSKALYPKVSFMRWWPWTLKMCTRFLALADAVAADCEKLGLSFCIIHLLFEYLQPSMLLLQTNRGERISGLWRFKQGLFFNAKFEAAIFRRFFTQKGQLA